MIANLLQKDIKKSAKLLGWWHRRMRDVQYYKGSASPFDEWVGANGREFGLECKIINDKAKTKSFAFSKVSEDQIKGMMCFEKQWNHKSFLIINFRHLNNRKGKTFAMPITEFLYLQHAMANKEKLKKKYPRNKKSIPLEYFEECTLELNRYKEGWDLRQLM